MNILYHHRTQSSGAAGHHINEMVKAFETSGYSVDVLSPFGVNKQQKAVSGSQKKNRYLIPQFFFEMLELCYNAVAFVKLIKQLKKKKYAFIYERYAIFNLAGILAARLFNMPIVLEVSFHSMTSVYPKRTKLFSRLANLADRFIFANAFGIVTVTAVLKTDLMDYFNVAGNKIIVLHNAADADVFNSEISAAQVRAKYNLNSDKVIGFAGGFYPWHGIDLLINAADDVLKIIPDAKFMLIGDGPLRKSLQLTVRSRQLEKAFIFTGSIPHSELPQYMSAFDVGVMPDSNDYGSPIKIFEYMAMGKPVLAPKLKPIEEVIINEKNGMLFEAKNKEALAEAIIKILHDRELYKKISLDSKRDLLDNHTWVKNAQAILNKWQAIFMAKEKIRFVSQYFYPEVASTAQLMVELAEGLNLKGCRIKAICGQPTYIKAKTLPRREIINGMEIERLSCTRLNKNSSIGRLLNWVSYTFLAFFKILFSFDRSPLFIVSQPPFLFVVGYLLKIIRGQEYICLIYDLYPDIAVKLGFMKESSPIARLWDMANKEFFKKAAFVVVPSENMKALIEKKIGKNDKVKVIYNWANGDLIKPIDKNSNWFAKKYDLTDKLVVLYSGNMGLFHELETIVEAADKLRACNNIRFVFIGEGGKKKKLMDMAADKQLNNVLFLPYQDKEVLPFSLTCSDISVVSLEKNLDCVAAPCKLYTSLAAGQIILGLVDNNSDVAKIVNKYNCGFCARQDDVGHVVKIIENLSKSTELLKQYQLNARKCFEENFTKEKSINDYYRIFSKN